MQAEQTPFRTDSVDASGLPDAFLVELLLRHFSRMGELRYSNMVRDQSLRLHPTTAQRLKVAMGNMVIAQPCKRVGVEFDTEAVDFMIDRLHPSYEQAYLPCIPYDVISKIRDRAHYLGQIPRLTPALIEWAWKMYFGVGDQPQQKIVRRNETEEATK